MLKLNDKLYISSINYVPYQKNFWQKIRDVSKSGGKFMIDLGLNYNPQRFVSRNGEWSLPWPQEIPKVFEMPALNKKFNKSFAEVTDNRAKELAKLIKSKNYKFAVMYSGGLDSTTAMAALIKNLSKEELKNVVVCADTGSMIENPVFWKKFIWGKINVLDSATHQYDDLIEKGYHPITTDEGDGIFGSAAFLDLFQNYYYYIKELSGTAKRHLINLKNKTTDGDTHYSEYKDLIIKHWNRKTPTKNVGEHWYSKFEKNIKTSNIPINSLHDYYWWMLFNLKWMSLTTRTATWSNNRIHCKKLIEHWLINWFNSKDYQQWSMTNNNNGEKIKLEMNSYKMAAKKYIYELDKNEYYFYFKLKVGSSNVLLKYQKFDHLPLEQNPNARFGLDNKFNRLYIDQPDVQEYIRYHMSNYEIDW